MKKEPLRVREDGTIPIITDDIKVVYSSQEINTNWLLNQILGTKDLQITKISNDEVLKFLHILSIGNLVMPDGQDSLVWLKKRLRKRCEFASAARSEEWENVYKRYVFILEQIDILLATKPST